MNSAQTLQRITFIRSLLGNRLLLLFLENNVRNIAVFILGSLGQVSDKWHQTAVRIIQLIIEYCWIISGASNFCLMCGHGGHTLHMLEWFQSHELCPSGCGCHCLESNPMADSWQILRNALLLQQQAESMWYHPHCIYKIVMYILHVHLSLCQITYFHTYM